jgi:hypothetical protein
MWYQLSSLACTCDKLLPACDVARRPLSVWSQLATYHKALLYIRDNPADETLFCMAEGQKQSAVCKSSYERRWSMCYANNNLFRQHLRFPQRYYWGFRSSCIWSRLVWEVPDVSKERVAFIFTQRYSLLSPKHPSYQLVMILSSYS